jgi:hypothetical protein
VGKGFVCFCSGGGATEGSINDVDGNGISDCESEGESHLEPLPWRSGSQRASG